MLGLFDQKRRAMNLEEGFIKTREVLKHGDSVERTHIGCSMHNRTVTSRDKAEARKRTLRSWLDRKVENSCAKLISQAS